MKYVIFSDIHGNADALKKILDVEAEGNKIFIFCGDVCGYYYDAKECVSLLKSIEGLVAVRGNHDQYYLDVYRNEKLTEQMAVKYGTSYKEKEKDVYDYISGLPLSQIIDEERSRLCIQHGAVGDELEGRIYPDSALPNVDMNTIYISGHTHYRMYREIGSSVWINPGSLGQPRDGKGFSYCVLDSDDMTVDFRTVDIDIAPLVKEIRRRDPGYKYLEEVLYR